MEKIDYTKLQDESEIDCVIRFLDVYNNFHSESFIKPVKNPVANEIDIICENQVSGKSLKIQIKKADPVVAGKIGINKKIPIENVSERLIIRDQDQFKNRILENIVKVEKKYTNQNKNMSDIILLLDEIMDPSASLVKTLNINKSIFKEIWISTRNNSYKIY